MQQLTHSLRLHPSGAQLGHVDAQTLAAANRRTAEVMKIEKRERNAMGVIKAVMFFIWILSCMMFNFLFPTTRNYQGLTVGALGRGLSSSKGSS